jgi:hypothetical protein
MFPLAAYVAFAHWQAWINQRAAEICWAALDCEEDEF